MTDKHEEVRQAAEANLETFIRLVAPHRVLGAVHRELLLWWTRSEAKSHQLVLLPRDHQKSALQAYYVAWRLTKDPTLTCLYVSSTSDLAEKQLQFIKDILTCKTYRRYWPEMVAEKEGQRRRWTNKEISVDHPLRVKEGIRDPSIKAAGLTTNVTGLHFSLVVLDDVVVYDNAYNEEGREKVARMYSLLSSVASGEAEQKAVGTRYHPDDIYGVMRNMKESVFNKEGEIVDEEPVYEVFQREVEDSGDGTGEFLWPRQQRPSDGAWFGFNSKILARKKAQYLDRTQFFAQYYNNPNDPESARLDYSVFQYYEREHIQKKGQQWYYKGIPLSVTAAIDIAYSVTKRADWTAIVVIGMDPDHNIYVLEIDRFKTDKVMDYFTHILAMWQKWGFRKLRFEAQAAQQVIADEIKENYIKKNGIPLVVDTFKLNQRDGSKEERIEASLIPRYQNKQIFHYRGGNCQILEEEVLLSKPSHDDVKDSLTSAITVARPPLTGNMERKKNPLQFNSRFGGVQ